MSSFSRNSQRANSSLRAIGAGLALSLASGAVLAQGAQQFMFAAYTDAIGGGDVLAGRYRLALEELKSHPGDMNLDPAATNTNRCVAYSMTLQWQQARKACDAAVRAADEGRLEAPAWLGWMRASNDEELALAYADRAVMYWMSGHNAPAQKDLARAQELAPRADFVAQNVAALKVRGILAVARTPAPKS